MLPVALEEVGAASPGHLPLLRTFQRIIMLAGAAACRSIGKGSRSDEWIIIEM